MDYMKKISLLSILLILIASCSKSPKSESSSSSSITTSASSSTTTSEISSVEPESTSDIELSSSLEVSSASEMSSEASSRSSIQSSSESSSVSSSQEQSSSQESNPPDPVGVSVKTVTFLNGGFTVERATLNEMFVQNTLTSDIPYGTQYIGSIPNINNGLDLTNENNQTAIHKEWKNKHGFHRFGWKPCFSGTGPPFQTALIPRFSENYFTLR